LNINIVNERSDSDSMMIDPNDSKPNQSIS